VAEEVKPLSGPVTIEQAFNVDGRKLTVLVQFPAAVAKDVGMETLVSAANRALVTIESKTHAVRKLRSE